MTTSDKAEGRDQTTLLVGFDSAWTANNSGGIVGVLRAEDAKVSELGSPQIIDYPQAQEVISKWKDELAPTAMIVLLDQPTIVPNQKSQRPVENIVGSVVSRRYGGMQPANTSKQEMFGPRAPIWPFLSRFGGAANPLVPVVGNRVFETYPVLAMIALGWTLPDSSPHPRPTGRMPKYNPDRRKNFSLPDWLYVCGRASDEFRDRELKGIVQWINNAEQLSKPRKEDQDRLDACLCLLVALHLAEGKECLMVGNRKTGCIVVPHSAELHGALAARCEVTGRVPAEWVRVFRLRG